MKNKFSKEVEIRGTFIYSSTETFEDKDEGFKNFLNENQKFRVYLDMPYIKFFKKDYEKKK